MAHTSSTAAVPAAAAPAGGLKAIARQVLSVKAIGVPVTLVAGAIGAERIRRRASQLCKYIPRVVTIRFPFRGEQRQFQMLSAGGGDFIVRAIWRGGWEHFEGPLTGLFAHWAGRCAGVIDVGANSGFYSVLAATCAPQATVHGFEPFPPVRQLMDQNIALNDLGSRVRCFPQAASEQVGELNLYVPKQETAGVVEMSCSLNADFRAEHADTIKVPVVTLDQHVAAGGIRKVDLLKIDVEGEEHRVLQGARQLLKDHRPVVFLEILPTAKADVIDEIRASLGYEVLLPAMDGVKDAAKLEHNPDHWNQVLCPTERKAEFLAAAEEARKYAPSKSQGWAGSQH